MFSKTLECALSAMALLARAHGQKMALTADQIAERQELNRPFLAKLLTQLVQGGLVASKPGRNGGFLLARDPAEISLYDVASSVGHRVRIECCPFGPEYGDEGNNCPMHEHLCQLRDQANDFLKKTTLAGFSE